MQRIMIAGTGSGCGKTTVTCAILSALAHKNIKASAFKCGPDYIDPMFYREILHTPSRNLDSFFCGRDMLLELFDEGSKDRDISVIEGVMGFYDGDEGSACCVSEITETPVILVLNCRGMKESIGAIMQGFLQYNTPNRIAGFIFNNLPERLVPFAKELCDRFHTEYFGFLPVHKYKLESRHLGLVTASEIEDIEEKMDALGKLAEEHFLIDKITSLMCNPLPEYRKFEVSPCGEGTVIAVSRDRAFCFLYEENIEVLKKLGCTVRFFSPLEDEHLPEADGLILCGGYPELYAEKLADNRTMLDDIRNAVLSGMPVIAECGGFMYLHEYLRTEDGSKIPLAGVIKGEVFPEKRLKRFGYITMKANSDSLIAGAGTEIKAHEFHYWESTDPGSSFTAVKPDGRSWECCHTTANMYAGFPHLYFPSDISVAERFVRACNSGACGTIEKPAAR